MRFTRPFTFGAAFAEPCGLPLAIRGILEHPVRRGEGPGALHRSTKCWVFLLFALEGITASGCLRVRSFGDGEGVNEKLDCELGSLGCLCDSWGACQLGLQCVRDRCEAADPGTPDAEPTTGAAPGTTTGGGGGAPEPGEPGTEPGEPDSSELPGTSSESSSPEQTSSSASSGSSSSSSTSSESSAPDRCEDGIQNFNETDRDCGGPACPACENGQKCQIDLDCVSQFCSDGVCRADDKPACKRHADCRDNNRCTRDRCVNQRCENTARADGTRCDDNERCTVKDRCLAGRCTGQDTRVFFETFSDPENLGFVLDYNPPERLWQVGTARASSCADPGYVEDPSKDHTQDSANGVLGVEVGGCSQSVETREFDCAWTRYMDVSFFEDDLHFSFWRRLSTPGVDAGRDGMRVRNAQYYRLEGDPTLYPFKEGFDSKVNDRKWEFDHRVLELNRFTAPVSFGICYRRLGGEGSFAGWTVDDVKVRQKGCEPNR